MYLVRDRLICVLDGVGGWIEILIDSGKMTKELITHIARNYDAGDFLSLHDLLDKSVQETKAKGSTTCVFAELPETSSSQDEVWMKTLNLGDSGYMILRPGASELEMVFKSES